ncbi:MAG: SDR family oxidoreductase [Pseudomonadota bacterium]
MNGITGTTALVTGASRGIGAAIAAALGQAGATVHVLAESDQIEGAAETIGATPHRADVTDTSAVARTLEAVGPLDILINNAGLERLTPIEDTSAETTALFRRILDINVTGTAIVTGHALPYLRPGARIVNTASVWGRSTQPMFGAYVASKHAVIGLTKTWARELGPTGTRVNAVCPGWVQTEAAIRSADALAAGEGRSRADILAEIAAAQALPDGVMQPGDVIGVYLFLASTLSANITGQTLGIDRGELPW